MTHWEFIKYGNLHLRDISIPPAVSQNAYVSKGNDAFWMGSGEVELADVIDFATHSHRVALDSRQSRHLDQE